MNGQIAFQEQRMDFRGLLLKLQMVCMQMMLARIHLQHVSKTFCLQIRMQASGMLNINLANSKILSGLTDKNILRHLTRYFGYSIFTFDVLLNESNATKTKLIKI